MNSGKEGIILDEAGPQDLVTKGGEVAAHWTQGHSTLLLGLEPSEGLAS